jgi:DegV family protein with EDD domain
VALATDSSCDIPQELIEKYRIHVVPLSIHFGETFYLDGITMKPEQFNKMLDTAPVYPSTSQPAFKEFYNRFNYLATHYQSLISINISSKLSGTWQNSLNAARKVAEQTGKKIDVVDSRRLTSGMGLIILRAAEALEQGMTHDELIAEVPGWIDKTRILVTTKTLKYMVKSGRVSNTKGFIGNLLNLKPVVDVANDGTIKSFGKPFTLKQSMRLVMKEFEKILKDRRMWGYAISHASDLKTAEWYAERMEKLTGEPPLFIHNASPALVANVGLGVVGINVLME